MIKFDICHDCLFVSFAWTMGTSSFIYKKYVYVLKHCWAIVTK